MNIYNYVPDKQIYKAQQEEATRHGKSQKE